MGGPTSTPKVVLWDIGRLVPYEGNAKLHDKAQVKKIAESIRQFGWTSAIVVDSKGVIIAGHGRRLAALQLGAKQVPVLVRDDLTDEEVRALRLADNRVALSGMDNELLRAELESLDFDLEGIFDKKELEFLNADLAEIDVGGFVDDLDAAVQEQVKETTAKVADLDNKDTPVAKALGFKSIKLKEEKYVAAFMASIESETGRQGAEAFIEHCKLHSGAA
jgi:hypothetical protein